MGDLYTVQGKPLGIILRVLGHPWKSILGSSGGLGRLWGSIGGYWVTLGPPFFGLGAALGVHFGGLGVPLGAFGAHHFRRFWTPNGALEAPKMGLQSLKNPFKYLSKLWLDFQAVSGAFLVN